LPIFNIPYPAAAEVKLDNPFTLKALPWKARLPSAFHSPRKNCSLLASVGKGKMSLSFGLASTITT
jgi:hypothetical protein